MKVKNLFLAAIVALGMVACNNEEVPQVNGAESTVSIRVMPTSNGPSALATGNLDDAPTSAVTIAESAIKKLEVYIFSGESPDGYGVATGSDIKEVKGVETHSGPKSIFVVSNANIGPVASKSELLNKTKDLPVDITANGLVMTSSETSVTLVAGQNYYGYSAGQTPTGEEHSVGSALKITRVNARVAIVSASLSTSLPAEQTAIFDALTNVEVAIFNVPKTTQLFGNPLVTSGDFLFGEAWPSTQGSYKADLVEGSFKNVITSGLPIESSNAPFYYVNENTSSVLKEQMLIVVRAKPTKGGNALTSTGLYVDSNGYTYYPVWVNKDGDITGSDGDAKVLRNTQYNITLCINGIGNPTIDEVENAFLDVIVNVEPWKVVTQNVTWN